MADSDPDLSPEPKASGRIERLDSWKEIAAYLNRDVTTVRRWEKREGLPVHRHRHRARGSVYAFAKEIDAWQTGREEVPSADELPAPRHPSARLVGRNDELRQLHTHLDRALQGQRQTVFIVGELGLGKSALTRAFLDEVASDVWVASGQCVEHYGKGGPYLPIVDALDRFVREDRSLEASRLVRLHAPSWVGRFSVHSPRPRRQREDPGSATSYGHMVGELTDAVEALTVPRPLILVLEDLHWSDQATVEFVARLARRPERARLLVIGTYRPTELFESGSPLLRVCRELRAHFQATEIELSQLTQAAVGDFIARDRTWNDLPGTAAFLRRWSGNPLFLAHFVAHLERLGHVTEHDGEWCLSVDGGDRIVPNSLRMLIEEQYDRLEPSHQRLLEIASVIGETFAAALVARVAPEEVAAVERSLEDLCRRSQLLMPWGSARLPDGAASASYAFVHGFYRQVVYDRVPNATAVELHRRIGTELAGASRSPASETALELAMHFDRGQDFRRAVEYYCLAAEEAVARNADREAQLGLSRAAELIVRLAPGPDRDELERRLGVQLGAVLGQLDHGVQAIGAGGDEGAGGMGTAGTPMPVEALTRLSYIHSVSGDLMAAKNIGDRAAAVGRVRGQTPLPTISQQAYVRLVAGEFAGSRLFGLQALEVADGKGVSRRDLERTRCSIVLAWAAWYLGRYGELREAITSMLADADSERLATVAPSVAPLLEWLGETDRGDELLRLLPNADGHASQLGVLWPADAVHGWLLVRRDRAAEGVRTLQRSVERLRATACQSWLPFPLVWLAEGLNSTAHQDDALAAADEGLNIVRRTAARCCDAELYRVRGEALSARAASGADTADATRDAAEASYWAAIMVARQQDAKTLELRATLGLCRLLTATGRKAEAMEALEPIHRQFANSGNTPDLAEAGRLLGSGAQ